ncbi:coiled-coil domain-containing protein 186 isoform X2 [Phlebotomus papatasi]|uniref:coiled-coil domain-containing protein 186 isoform X2 n=1 Tax=Phlebotomus papatasi TaxID=29031 RepID=UPI00248353A6|nr:coiled-coil domain-containing protein 186 isoform X2 [Phlebotomus papatasi]
MTSEVKDLKKPEERVKEDDNVEEDVSKAETPSDNVTAVTEEEVLMDNKQTSEKPVDDDVMSESSQEEKIINGEYGGQESISGSIVNEADSKYLEEQANLKVTIENLQAQCHYLQTMVNQREETISTFDKTKVLLEKENQLMRRELDLAVREKENAVIKYCTLEKKVIDANQLKEGAEKKSREAQKECELLNGKIKMLNGEKNRICTMLDQKCHEIRSHQKEIERLKGENSNLESKAKWSAGKIKQETDAKQVAEKRVEELTLEVAQLKSNEAAWVKSEADSERVSHMEKQCMEQQASLILLKHGNEEKEVKIDALEKKLQEVQIDLTDMRTKYSEVFQEKENFRDEVDKLKGEISELQTTLDQEVLKVADFQSKLSDLEATKAQLTMEKENSARQGREYEVLMKNYEDNLAELEEIRTKESELLQFNRDLTERNVKLQNEITLYNSKAVALCLENEAIKKEKKTYDDRISELERDLDKERNQKNDERILLTKHISEKTKLCEGTQKKLDSALGDLDAVKRKHAQTVKELNRELEKMRRRQQVMHVTSENSSEKESSPQVSDTDSQGSHRVGNSDCSTPPPVTTVVPGGQEPSRQALIDRILRLQQASARQAEKIDFLENHSATLVSEVQKKTKVLQYYMLRDQCGALASSKSDRHKAELAKYGGGIMAAIYGGATSSKNAEMTLDLSLEINRKLQALLEDTLLKNITLKENLDTLGLEVDKLTRRLASK